MTTVSRSAPFIGLLQLATHGCCCRVPEILNLTLWNPTTGEKIALPYFALASPILSDSWAYGLMFDPARQLWKVLRSRVMDKFCIEEENYVELLSSANDSWKQIPSPRLRISPCQQSSLYINGFYYWPTEVGFIVRFDFAEERFGALIHEPKSDKFPNASVSSDTACLVEYDASLASVVFKRGGRLKKMEVPSIPDSAERKPFGFEIWVWKEASATWSCLSRGEIPVSDASVKRVLGLYKKRKLLLERSCGNLWVYDVQTKALDNLGIRGGGMRLVVFPYVVNAEPSRKSSWKNCSSSSTCTLDGGVPATIRAHTRALEPNNCDGLMLMVQCVLDWTRNYFIISMENNNSFKVLLQDDDENNLLGNLSRLVPEDYDIEDSMNAKYHVLASCNTWMLWEYTEIPSDPEVLLWDPRTGKPVKLPFFRAKPRMHHPVFECMWGYGIEFDPCALVDYKVVRCRVFEYFRSSKEAHAELFSFETWKEIPCPHDLQWEVFQDPSLFIDGFYYWTAKHPTKEDLAIISFDFAKEEFPPAVIPMPSSEIVRDITCDCVCIAELDGLLAAIVFVNNGQEEKSMKKNKQQKQMETEENRVPFVFEIYVWKKGSWHHDSTHEFLHPNPAVCMRVVGLYKNDKVFLEDSEGNLCVYSLEKSMLMLEKVVGIRDDTSSLKIFPFV